MRTKRELTHDEHRFTASLQGIKLGDYGGIDTNAPDITDNPVMGTSGMFAVNEE